MILEFICKKDIMPLKHLSAELWSCAKLPKWFLELNPPGIAPTPLNVPEDQRFAWGHCDVQIHARKVRSVLAPVTVNLESERMGNCWFCGSRGSLSEVCTLKKAQCLLSWFLCLSGSDEEGLTPVSYMAAQILQPAVGIWVGRCRPSSEPTLAWACSW